MWGVFGNVKFQSAYRPFLWCFSPPAFWELSLQNSTCWSPNQNDRQLQMYKFRSPGVSNISINQPWDDFVETPRRILGKDQFLWFSFMAISALLRDYCLDQFLESSANYQRMRESNFCFPTLGGKASDSPLRSIRWKYFVFGKLSLHVKGLFYPLATWLPQRVCGLISQFSWELALRPLCYIPLSIPFDDQSWVGINGQQIHHQSSNGDLEGKLEIQKAN